MLKIGEIIYEDVNDKFNLIKRLTAIIFLAATIFIIESFFILIVVGRHFFSNLFWQIIKYLIILFLPYIIWNVLGLIIGMVRTQSLFIPFSFSNLISWFITIGTNIAWAVYECQYSTELVTIEAQQEADADSTNYIIGGNYGETDSKDY